MKILQVIPDLRKGGAERLVLDICNALHSRGVEVCVLNFRPENEYAFLSEKIQRVIVPARFIPSLTGKPLRQVEAYAAFLAQYRPHVIHTHLFEAEMVTRQVIVQGVKYVSHVHSHLENFKNFSTRTLLRKQALARFYEKKILLKQYRKCHNNFIAVTDETAAYLKTVLPADLHRITTLPNAIDYKKFFTAETHRMEQPLRLVTIGRLDENKNQFFLVHVVKRLQDAGISATLDIVGEGVLREEIQRLAAELGIADAIYLRGRVDAVEQFLHNSHLYVHAAKSESFGLVCIEAMAAGLPCVMLQTVEKNAIVKNKETGYVIPQENAMLFAEAIIKMMKSAALYAQLSENAKTYAKQFDIEPYADKLLHIYASCAAAGKLC